MWLTLWQNGFAGDVLGIDNQRTGLLPPTNKDQCKNGGWQSLSRTDFTTFKNQGDCIHVASKVPSACTVTVRASWPMPGSAPPSACGKTAIVS